MRATNPAIAGAVVGVIGLALLLFESIRALTGSSFNTLATILLYGGVGLIAVAGVMLIAGTFAGAAEAAPDPAGGAGSDG